MLYKRQPLHSKKQSCTSWNSTPTNSEVQYWNFKTVLDNIIYTASMLHLAVLLWKMPHSFLPTHYMPNHRDEAVQLVYSIPKHMPRTTPKMELLRTVPGNMLRAAPSCLHQDSLVGLGIHWLGTRGQDLLLSSLLLVMQMQHRECPGSLVLSGSIYCPISKNSQYISLQCSNHL